MMESDHNKKLKKMMLDAEKENVAWGVETLKQLRNNLGFLQGYTDSDLYEITNGFGALYRGIVLGKIMGNNPKNARMAWIRTIYAIYNSKK